MIIKISPKYHCPNCNIRYQRKHTCPGRGHRRAKCSSGLDATDIHNIKGRHAFPNSEVSSSKSEVTPVQLRELSGSAIYSSTPSSKQPLAASNTTSHLYHSGQRVLWLGSSLNTAITPSDGGPLLDSALYSYPPDPLSYTVRGQYTKDEAQLIGICKRHPSRLEWSLIRQQAYKQRLDLGVLPVSAVRAREDKRSGSLFKALSLFNFSQPSNLELNGLRTPRLHQLLGC
jgi:hypothetical protein